MTTISAEFDGGDFWDHAKQYGRRIGEALMSKAMVAYFVAVDSETPAWAKAALGGALAYFALPADLVPDFIPVMGFADDATALSAALAAVVTCVEERHLHQADEKMRRWGFTFQRPGAESE